MNFNNVRDRILNIIQGNTIEQELKSLPTIGERLVYLRKRKKLTRKALSPLIGIEYNVLHKYETNKYKPKADRIKMFSEFYDVPEEYITGEEKNELDIDDIYFIGNLKHYCWEIQVGLKKVKNYDDLILSILKADRVVVKSISTYCKFVDDDSYLIYIYKIFSNNQIPELNIIEDSEDAVDGLLLNLIGNYENDEEKIKMNIDYISKIFDYGICTLCILNKNEYNQVIEELQPLIDSYIENSSKSEE